ncbi:MAG TPA: hypothetical protein VFG59_07700 [Anaeromyxobacter sp.]|nr:hypothetical protein [Anaeromyxobacter sp.]
MRLARLAIIAALLAEPALALARTWKGINPGTSLQAEVVQRFGEPTARTKRGNRTVLAYYGDQALEGTRQAQFHVDAAGIVQEITIFLSSPLDAETIEGTYGKPTKKTFVEDTFQKVWIYGSQGVTVYWAKDGSGAEALSFGPAKPEGKPVDAGKPAAEGTKAGGN